MEEVRKTADLINEIYFKNVDMLIGRGVPLEKAIDVAMELLYRVLGLDRNGEEEFEMVFEAGEEDEES